MAVECYEIGRCFLPVKQLIVYRRYILIMTLMCFALYNRNMIIRSLNIPSEKLYQMHARLSYPTRETNRMVIGNTNINGSIEMEKNINVQKEHSKYTSDIDGLAFREGEVIWSDPPGDFQQRLAIYNEAMDQLRSQMIQQSHLPWRDLKTNITLIDGFDEGTLYKTANTKLFTLALSRRNVIDKDGNYPCLEDNINYLIQNYFIGSSATPYCDYTTKLADQLHAVKIPIYQCNENITRSLKPRCLKPIDLFPRHYWGRKNIPDSKYSMPYRDHLPEYVFYIHGIYDGVINEDGYVFTESIKLVDLTCKVKYTTTIVPDNYKSSPLYSEVFVMSQVCGSMHYHSIAEALPRTAPYIDFLKKHEEIKILASDADPGSVTAKALEIMGINPNRIVTGVVRAKIVYLPQGSSCSYPNQHLVQVASLRYRQYMDKKTTNTTRNSMVVIHRTKDRLLRNYDAKEQLMRTLAKDFKFKFEVFSDDPVPPFEKQMEMFRRAVVIIGPHGAGLVNMMYSEPGTVVVEGTGSPPRLNLCFVRLAYILGHHHHAIPTLGKWAGFVNINTHTWFTQIKKVLNTYFKKRLATDQI